MQKDLMVDMTAVGKVQAEANANMMGSTKCQIKNAVSARTDDHD